MEARKEEKEKNLYNIPTFQKGLNSFLLASLCACFSFQVKLLALRSLWPAPPLPLLAFLSPPGKHLPRAEMLKLPLKMPLFQRVFILLASPLFLQDNVSLSVTFSSKNILSTQNHAIYPSSLSPQAQ